MVSFKSLRDFLTKEQPNILSASVIMMFLLAVTKIVGMFTKTIAVSQLGAENYGIFIAANTLPETLSMILIFGSITSVIIPMLVGEIQNNGRGSFSTLFSSLVNSGLLALTIVTILIVVTADRITPFIIEEVAKPVEPFSSEQISQISDMMQWLMIPQIILGISTFLSSALNSFKRFVVPQLAPLFYNIGILFGALFFIPVFEEGVWGLTLGVIIGSFLHLLIQLPLVSHLKIQYKFIIDLKNSRLWEILFVGLPRIIALIADQFAIFIDRLIAIGLGAAPLGAYYLAVSLVTIPYSLFSGTFSIAALPHLSTAFAKKDMKTFRRIFLKVFNQILFLTVPVTVVLLVLRLPLVRLLYGILGREFTWGNTLMVAWVVFFFTLGLIPEVLLSFLNRAFYSICDTVRPLIVGVYIVVGGIITGILFTNYFSHFEYFSLGDLRWDPSFFLSKRNGLSAVGGLALSSSIVYSTGFVILFLLFSKKVGKFSFENFYKHVFKKLFFGFVMAIFMYLLFKIWDEVLDTARTINVFILTVSTIIPGTCIYLWLLYISKDTEIGVIEKIYRYIKKYVKI